MLNRRVYNLKKRKDELKIIFNEIKIFISIYKLNFKTLPLFPIYIYISNLLTILHYGSGAKN